MKILFWEAAEEWKTWNKLDYRPDDFSKLEQLVKKAQSSGIVRQDFDPALFPTLVMTITAGAINFSQRFGSSFWADDERSRQQKRLAEAMVTVIKKSLLTRESEGNGDYDSD